jgi:CDP-4-dehydro-6-deoxyglucose reductase, E1
MLPGRSGCLPHPLCCVTYLPDLKDQILSLTRDYARQAHAAYRPAADPARTPWPEGSPIPYAGRVFTETEVEAAVSATLDFWLTLGSEGAAMEQELAAFMGVRHSLLVNSGSSANLVAISALTSAKLPEARRIKPGDEVITVAAGFPTTVAPIVQVGAVPVFIDADPITGNARCDQLEAAYSAGKTKAVMMAHALGNPFDLAATLAFCQKYNLWLVEDNCDALGCSYSMPRELAESLGFSENSPGLDEGPDRVVRWTGTWGDISTQSFYPPHHLTMGEGGAVNIVRDQKLKVIAESFRDWGRDCWCPSGIDNTCNKRFGWQLGELPEGYDHKYTYSHLGFNLKPLDPQAAIGRVQLRRLPEFIEARKQNWEKLRRGLAAHEDVLEFALPTHATAGIRSRASAGMQRLPHGLLLVWLQDCCEANARSAARSWLRSWTEPDWQPHAVWRQPASPTRLCTSPQRPTRCTAGDRRDDWLGRNHELNTIPGYLSRAHQRDAAG